MTAIPTTFSIQELVERVQLYRFGNPLHPRNIIEDTRLLVVLRRSPLV